MEEALHVWGQEAYKKSLYSVFAVNLNIGQVDLTVNIFSGTWPRANQGRGIVAHFNQGGDCGIRCWTVVGLHSRNFLSSERLLSFGISQTWEGQSVQDQQGPRSQSTKDTENKKTQLIHRKKGEYSKENVRDTESVTFKKPAHTSENICVCFMDPSIQ